MNEARTDFSSDAISGAVRSLLERPELLSSVASALGVDLGAVKKTHEGTVQEASEEKNVTKNEPDTDGAMAAFAPVLSRLCAGGTEFRHEALLCALKPYVSPSRADAIDHILKFAKMSSLVKGLR